MKFIKLLLFWFTATLIPLNVFCQTNKSSDPCHDNSNSNYSMSSPYREGKDQDPRYSTDTKEIYSSDRNNNSTNKKYFYWYAPTYKACPNFFVNETDPDGDKKAHDECMKYFKECGCVKRKGTVVLACN